MSAANLSTVLLGKDDDWSILPQARTCIKASHRATLFCYCLQAANSVLPSQGGDLGDELAQIIDARPSARLAPASNKLPQVSQDEVAQLVEAGLTADLPDDDVDFSSEDEDAVLVQAPAKEDSKVGTWSSSAPPAGVGRL